MLFKIVTNTEAGYRESSSKPTDATSLLAREIADAYPGHAVSSSEEKSYFVIDINLSLMTNRGPGMAPRLMDFAFGIADRIARDYHCKVTPLDDAIKCTRRGNITTFTLPNYTGGSAHVVRGRKGVK